MIVYAVAIATSLLGRTTLATHLPTALASAGTVFVVFWLGRLLFGRDESGQATPWRCLAFDGEWKDAAEILNALPSETGLVYLIPDRYKVSYGFDYLYQGATPVTRNGIKPQSMDRVPYGSSTGGGSTTARSATGTLVSTRGA